MMSEQFTVSQYKEKRGVAGMPVWRHVEEGFAYHARRQTFLQDQKILNSKMLALYLTQI